jgi:hypothetical protein
MSVQKDLEAKMEDALVKNAPFQIPSTGRKIIVEWAPWLVLLGGILSLLAAVGLWNMAHKVDNYNNLVRTYGIDTTYHSIDYGTLFYVSFIVLIAQGLLMLYAFSGLKARSKKRGWDVLLLGVVANFVYNVIYAFTDSGSLINLAWAIIDALIGLYLLAQIKTYYNGQTRHPKKQPNN